MISLPAKPSQSVAARSVYYPPNVLMACNNAASSLWVDGTTQAASLYPRNFNDSTNLGAVNTYLNNQYNESSGVITVNFDSMTSLFAQNESRYMVGEAFFNKYKGWKAIGIKSELGQQKSNDTMNRFFDMIEIDTDKFVIKWYNSNQQHYQVGQIGSDLTITWGTRLDTSLLTGNAFILTEMCQVDTNKFAVIEYKTATTFPFITIFSVSGTTITAGTPVQIVATDVQECRICKIDTDKVFVGYRDTATATLYFHAITISALVPTVGAQTAGTTASKFLLRQNGTDKVAIVQGYSSSGFKMAGATISGTAITLGAPVIISDSASSSGNVKIVDDTNPRRGDWIKMATDKFLLITDASPSGVLNNGYKNIFIVTYSGTTPSITKSFALSSGFVASANSNLVEITAGSKYAYYNGYFTTSAPKCSLVNIDGSDNVTLSPPKTTSLYDPSSDWANADLRVIKVGNNFVGDRCVSGSKHDVWVGKVGITFEAYNGTLLMGGTRTLDWGLVYQPFNLQGTNSAMGGSKGYIRIKKTSSGTDKLQFSDFIVEVE